MFSKKPHHLVITVHGTYNLFVQTLIQNFSNYTYSCLAGVLTYSLSLMRFLSLLLFVGIVDCYWRHYSMDSPGGTPGKRLVKKRLSYGTMKTYQSNTTIQKTLECVFATLEDKARF